MFGLIRRCMAVAGLGSQVPGDHFLRTSPLRLYPMLSGGLLETNHFFSGECLDFWDCFREQLPSWRAAAPAGAQAWLQPGSHCWLAWAQMRCLQCCLYPPLHIDTACGHHIRWVHFSPLPAGPRQEALSHCGSAHIMLTTGFWCISSPVN